MASSGPTGTDFNGRAHILGGMEAQDGGSCDETCVIMGGHYCGGQGRGSSSRYFLSLRPMLAQSSGLSALYVESLCGSRLGRSHRHPWRDYVNTVARRLIPMLLFRCWPMPGRCRVGCSRVVAYLYRLSFIVVIVNSSCRTSDSIEYMSTLSGPSNRRRSRARRRRIVTRMT